MKMLFCQSYSTIKISKTYLTIKNRPMKKESYARSACTKTTKNSSKTHSQSEGYIIEKKRKKSPQKNP